MEQAALRTATWRQDIIPWAMVSRIFKGEPSIFSVLCSVRKYRTMEKSPGQA
jgi:hypothetical protein